MSDSPPVKVVAVIVAWNRRALLLEALSAVLNQSVPVAAVVVVDNASEDGSSDAVRREAPSVDLITLSKNVGGAGGFALGMGRALAAHGADFVWLMDDDTIPDAAALEALVRAVEEPAVVLAGSRVVWTDGSDHPMNTPRPNPFASRADREASARNGRMSIRSSSFVSMLVSAESIRERGLPIADYFIWNDDFEFSTRILRGARGRFVRDSVVVHKTVKLGSTDLDPGDRFYYEVRNKIWMFSRSNGLSAGEKIVYGASTSRRWIRTFRRSGDRRRLRLAMARGVRDGIRRAPRPNEIVLAEAGIAESELPDFLFGPGRA